jgi:hypothetical protein
MSNLNSNESNTLTTGGNESTEPRLRGPALDAADQKAAIAHVVYERSRNPDGGLHLDGEDDTLYSDCAISRNGPARFRVKGPTLHGLPAEPRFESSTRPFSLRQVFWL